MSRASSLSRATRTSRAESSGWPKRGATASVSDGAGSGGGSTVVRSVSARPDARVTITTAVIDGAESTGIPPIAVRVPGDAVAKCNGSPASVPVTAVIASLVSVAPVRVSLTIAPGFGCVGEMLRRGSWASTEVLANARSPSTATSLTVDGILHCKR